MASRQNSCRQMDQLVGGIKVTEVLYLDGGGGRIRAVKASGLDGRWGIGREVEGCAGKRLNSGVSV